MSKKIPNEIKILRLGRNIVSKKWIQGSYGTEARGFCAAKAERELL